MANITRKEKVYWNNFGRAVLLKQGLLGPTSLIGITLLVQVGLLGQTPLRQMSLLGLTSLRLWQTSLEQTDLLERLFLGKIPLLG